MIVTKQEFELEEFENDMTLDEIYADLAEYDNKIDTHNQRLLKAIKSVKGKDYFNDLKAYMEESTEYLNKCVLVDTPKGDYQSEEEFPLLGGVWVDQWRNGGYTGDDFAGDLYVKIERENKKEKYLKIPYSC